MKRIDLRKVLFMICGVIALNHVFTSCALDDPEPVPAEELYLREFIKLYGLIDPDQDWNQAERATINVVTDGAKSINVFVKCAAKYYRVANFIDVTGAIEIPLDVPEGTSKLFVEVDGQFYSVKVGGTLDVTTARHRAPKSRTHVSADIVTMPDPHSTFEVTATGYIDCSADAKYVYVYNGGANNNVYTNSKEIHNLSDGTKIYIELKLPLNTEPYFIMKFKTATTNHTKLRARIFGWSGDYLDETFDIEPKASASNDCVLSGANVEEHELLLYFPKRPASDWVQMVFEVTQTDGSGSAGTLGDIEFVPFASEDMAWLLVAEDLGGVDDFDFNDMIIRIESLTTNTASVAIEDEYWQVVTDEEDVMLRPSRAGSRAAAYTKLRITSMCAGGILDTYLHFRTPDGKDFVLQPGSEEYDLTTSTPSISNYTEWHQWFNCPLEGDENHRPMLNTGRTSATTKSATIIVPDEFSMTQYSQIFRDYDGELDYFNNGKFNENNFNYTAWSYSNNPDYKIVGFYITVGGPTVAECTRILGQPKAGAAPQIFLIPDVGFDGPWHWAKERVPLTSVYPRFASWVRGNEQDWYMDRPVQQAETKEGGLETPAYMSR